MKRLISYCLLLLCAAAALAGCGTGNGQAMPQQAQSSTLAADKPYYTFRDSLNREVILKEKPQRVIALFGSYAETWLLAGGELCGVTDDVISERKLQVGGDTKIIGTVKDPNMEEVLHLSPDLVLLSADLEAHVKLSATLQAANIPCAFFKVEHFEDYRRMLKICTDITGRSDLYETNSSQVEAQIKEILAKVDTAGKQPTVLFVRAMSGKAKAMTGDNMTSKMLADLHTDNIAARHGFLLEDLSMETILAEDPDFIFVVTMGNSEKALQSLREGIQSNPAWGSLSAVKNHRYIVLPVELFHYKPNARWGESYAYLAKILYPNQF